MELKPETLDLHNRAVLLLIDMGLPMTENNTRIALESVKVTDEIFKREDV